MNAGGIVARERSVDELVKGLKQPLALTAEQSAVVSAPVTPTLVVAGAGSGKTETLSLRMMYLLDHAPRLFGRPLEADEILCLSFTRKAAAEIGHKVTERLNDVFGPDPERALPSVSTYNAYSAGLVSEHGLRVGVDPGSVALTDASLWQMASRIVETWVDPLDVDAAVSTVTAAIPRLAATLADHGVSLDAMAEMLETMAARMGSLPLAPRARSDKVQRATASALRSRSALAALVRRFNDLKRAGSFIDFADQVAIARELAAVPVVADAERSRYAAVLLDEFQDTSPGQLDMFAHLFGSQHSVMAVGDPHQAIYGFRGAGAHSLEAFVDQFGGAVVNRFTLSVSWRNSTEILEAANAVSEPLRAQSRVDVPELRSRAQDRGTPDPPHAGAAVTSHMSVDALAESDWIVREVVTRRAALESSRPEAAEQVTAAILCRARRQFPELVAALIRADVPYQVVGLGGLLSTPAVVELVALLQVAHDPSRGDSLMRVLTSERMNLGIRDLAALGEWSEEVAGPRSSRATSPSIVDTLDHPPRPTWVSRDGRSLTPAARKRIDGLRAVVDQVRTHAYLPVAELVVFASRAWSLDIEAALAAGQGDAPAALDALVEAAGRFAGATDHATLGGFLAYLDAAVAHERGLDSPVDDPRPGTIALQTVHSAKGMEWDVVGIPGLMDGAFPSFDGQVQGADPVYKDAGWLTGMDELPWPMRRDWSSLPVFSWEAAENFGEYVKAEEAFRIAAGAHRFDEERRLFYVAVTRARHDVILTGSWFGWASTPRVPSAFVLDLVKRGIVDARGWEPEPDGDVRSTWERSRVSLDWPVEATTVQLARQALAVEVTEAMDGRTEPHVGPMPYERDIDALLVESAREHASSAVVDLPFHLSTTSLVGLARDRVAFAQDLRRPVPVEPQRAGSRGSAFHAWVECHFSRPSLWEPDDSHEDSDGPDAELDLLREAFLQTEWAHLRPVAVEANIEIPIGGIMLRCRIDAVFGPGDGIDLVTVVDWKTGRPPSDLSEQRARDVQLAAYRLGWAEWTGTPLDQVDAAFVYVSTGETVRPSSLLDRDGIIALIRGDS